MRNTVALGASLALIGAPFAGLEKMLTDQFKRKGPEVVSHNVSLAKAGYDYINQTYGSETDMHLAPPAKDTPAHLIINGSEASGAAAACSPPCAPAAAGCVPTPFLRKVT
jgi:hypothetical protein